MTRHHPNGIEALFDMPSARPVLVAVNEVALRKWSGKSSIELWQAVLLHSFVDPDSFAVDADASLQFLQSFDVLFNIGRISHPPVEDDWCIDERNLWKSVRSASEAAEFGEMPVEKPKQGSFFRASVRLAEFAAWARKAKFPVTGDWPKRAALGGEVLASGPWPWGRYETVGLKALAAAVERYWRPVSDGGTYDPSSGARRSSIEEIAAWIVEAHGLKADRARYIAKIIRPDELQYGRIPSDE